MTLEPGSVFQKFLTPAPEPGPKKRRFLSESAPALSIRGFAKKPPPLWFFYSYRVSFLQIYPLALLMKYIDRNGNVVSMGDGGMFDFARDLMYSEALKQCNLDAVYCTFTFAVKVFR